MADKNTYKAMLAGVAGGMVASWAMHRFYHLAKESTLSDSVWPYIVGAGIGATYATIIQRRDVPLIARVPLGAAVWLGNPAKTAAVPPGGRNVQEKARNAALRVASTGLRNAAERALFA